MRLNGHGSLTFEDARTWIEETGLCLFLPRKQYSASVAPSFVEAVAGQPNTTPDPKHISLAEDLLVRLEHADVAVRLNLLGQPGEQPDFVVASWVLPYVYALRGDRDWRRSPQLTGSRQVSPLAVQAYKLLEQAELTIPQLKHSLGREVTETAVIRAITELWQQLRIIPVLAAPAQAAKWQLLRIRYQKAIAEGASTSQVTAISVLASIYLQAVIAATMEEVELFLAPLTARSKIREVLRGLVATRQVHTISLGHSPHFYVAGTLPEFGSVTSFYTSAAFQASTYFLNREDHHEVAHQPAPPAPVAQPAPVPTELHSVAASSAPRMPAKRRPASPAKSPARQHFSRPASHARDRKPAQGSSNGRVAGQSRTESRSTTSRTTTSRSPANRSSGTRSAKPTNGARWKAAPANGAKRNGASNGASHKSSMRTAHSNGNGAHRSGSSAPAGRSAGISNGRSAKPAASARTVRSTGKPVSKSGNSAMSRKPALTATAKAGNSKRYGLTVKPQKGTKKRG
jgi:hypothetical protein